MDCVTSLEKPESGVVLQGLRHEMPDIYNFLKSSFNFQQAF